MKTAPRPGCERGAALAALVVLIFLLVASTAILWPRFSTYRKNFAAVKKDLAEARREARALSQRPTLEELAAARTALAETRTRLLAAEGALAEKTQASETEAARAGRAEAQLADARASVEELTGELESVGKRAKDLADAKARLEADLVTTVESYENARRAASGKEDILDKLDATARKLSAAERSLASGRKDLAGKTDALLKLQADLDRAKAVIAERDAGLSRLRKELSEIPIMPLPDELAKQKYHEYLNSVAEYTDRESRVSTLFRAKIALTGSAYESKADAQWRRELKMKQDDVDRAARFVYEDVTSRIHVHPDAHDENVRLLQEALEKVALSRYGKIIQQLIDREHELKAAGR